MAAGKKRRTTARDRPVEAGAGFCVADVDDVLELLRSHEAKDDYRFYRKLKAIANNARFLKVGGEGAFVKEAEAGLSRALGDVAKGCVIMPDARDMADRRLKLKSVDLEDDGQVTIVAGAGHSDQEWTMPLREILAAISEAVTPGAFYPRFAEIYWIPALTLLEALEELGVLD